MEKKLYYGIKIAYYCFLIVVITMLNLKQCKMDTLKTKIDAHFIYEGWNFNSGNYLFTTDTK